MELEQTIYSVRRLWPIGGTAVGYLADAATVLKEKWNDMADPMDTDPTLLSEDASAEVVADALNELPESMNRQLFLAYMQTPVESESARLGPGIMVHRDYARAMGRLRFFFAMHRLKPEVCRTLCTDLAIEAAAKMHSSWERSHPQMDAMLAAHKSVEELLEVGPMKPALREAIGRALEASRLWLDSADADTIRTQGKLLSQHVWAWQARWNLFDDWIADGAYFTLDFAAVADSAGYTFDGPIALDMDSLHARHEVTLSDIPIVIKVDVSSFDPGTESVSVYADRVIREVARPQIIDSLHALMKSALAEQSAVSSVTFRSVSAFEWLVRYQALGESKNAIAKDIGKDRGHVTREINRVAELIGLTLRT